MRMELEPAEKQRVFKDFFGAFNPEVFEFVLDKLNGDQW